MSKISISRQGVINHFSSSAGDKNMRFACPTWEKKIVQVHPGIQTRRRSINVRVPSDK